MDYFKITTDETLRETVQHGSERYPFAYYPEDIWQFDFHRIDWHWHHELEFLYVAEGTAICFIGTSKVELHKGCGIFINSGVLHCFEARSSTFTPNIVFAPTLLEMCIRDRVTPKFLAEQLDSIFTDINPDAIKTGMVSSSELIETIADKLTEYHAKNIVVDPVMVATSGARLISEEAIGTLKSKLLPLATVINPNIPEAEVLSEMEIKTEADMEKAAETICNTLGCAVLLKGGHQLNDANDLLFQKGKEPVWFHGKRIDNPNTHGTGCTLSSAIASNLAKGRDLETSVKYAKNYISGALADMLDLGKGSGPMNHAFAIEGEYER